MSITGVSVLDSLLQRRKAPGAAGTASASAADGSSTAVDLPSYGSVGLSLTAKEVEEARKRYLGSGIMSAEAAAAAAAAEAAAAAARKKKQRAGPDPNKNWDASEDTSDAVNPLYALSAKAAPALAFGKGFQAGIDVREQRKASAAYVETLARKREAEAVALAEAAREAAASAAALLRRKVDGDSDGDDGFAGRSALAAARARRLGDGVDDLGPRRSGAAGAAAGGAGAGSSGGGGGAKSGSGSLADRHWSDKPLSSMSDRDWRIMREDFDIRVKGGRACHPLRSWNELVLDSRLRRAIDDAGYIDPTPIQRQAIPMGMLGRDLIGVAETGSGKTAAFLVPLLQYVLDMPATARASVADAGPLALVMAPTRELAQQIESECRKLCAHAGISSLCVVGGTSIQEQGHIIRDGVDIIIGTPGRLIDALNQGFLVLHACRYIVLDEADRMIDLGFEPQVNQILDAMGGRGAEHDAAAAAAAGGAGAGSSRPAAPPRSSATSGSSGAASSALGMDLDVAGAALALASGSADGAPLTAAGRDSTARTTHMFTATLAPEVERLARKYMRSPATVKIGDEDSGKNRRIAQEVLFLSGESRKRAKLLEVLRRVERPAIVFVNAKKQCDVVARDMEEAGINCTVLHSGKGQELREESLAEFKAGTFDVLVATDVAARGLDIAGVAHVINYDMPSEIDRYTHRIGRTGRAGKSGKATTFISEEDSQELLVQLKAHLEACGQAVPPELKARASAEGGGRGDKVRFSNR